MDLDKYCFSERCTILYSYQEFESALFSIPWLAKCVTTFYACQFERKKYDSMIYYFYLLIGLILGLDQNTEVLSVCLTALNTSFRLISFH